MSDPGNNESVYLSVQSPATAYQYQSMTLTSVSLAQVNESRDVGRFLGLLGRLELAPVHIEKYILKDYKEESCNSCLPAVGKDEEMDFRVSVARPMRYGHNDTSFTPADPRRRR